MTKSTIVQSARIIMGLASEMVDTIKSSTVMLLPSSRPFPFANGFTRRQTDIDDTWNA